MSGRYWEDEYDFMDDWDEEEYDDIDYCIEGDSFGEYFGDH